MRAINKETGAEVRAGDTVTDFRGETATFVSATRAPMPGKSGKVLVERNGNLWEYYDRVYGLSVEA